MRQFSDTDTIPDLVVMLLNKQLCLYMTFFVNFDIYVKGPS